ncbi:MAG TPA: molybdopterin-synthase adenylyltransferase MoeB, partial [Thermoflexales bacterium]|nr:molybdopterin-synthase adenylyltransferase MoeB [Thermoflexales bacterium]
KTRVKIALILMSISIRIPTPLRAHTAGAKQVSLEAGTVAQALDALAALYPSLKTHLFDDAGKLRPFVNVYVGDEDVRYLNGMETALPDGAALSIIPGVAGGNDATLSNAEMRRYSRHLILPDVGLAGQKKLKAARVLVVGTGGLGSPTALYLAAAGVGKIGLMDFDVVDESNLQRQIIHGTSGIGKLKVDSARERMTDLNPFVQIVTYNEPLTSQNALEIIREYDIVIDGTDNFQTRYLTNDACVMLGKLNVYGSIFRFDGQASVFGAKDGPCYRCLYPEPPPPGLVPSCEEGGVLGVLPGIIGVVQATEAVKLILGIGEPLVGRLLVYDALEMSFRTLKLRKNPQCPVCGEHPTITQLIDYDEFCGVKPHSPAPGEQTTPEITVKELDARMKAGLGSARIIDVRQPFELDIVSLPGSTFIPYDDVFERMDELTQASELFIICRTGRRSAEITDLLRESGYANAKNVKGGLRAWSQEIDPSMPTY